MAASNFRLLTALPPLGAPGTPPPLTPAALRTEVGSSAAAALVDVVLQGDELRQPQDRNTGDQRWQRYWRNASKVARTRRSAFLRSWLRFEVSLQQALANARAGQPIEPLTPELLTADELVQSTAAAWRSAPDPLAGMRLLLRARWDWVSAATPHYSFSDDEVAAYAVRLIILRDWHRIMGATA